MRWLTLAPAHAAQAGLARLIHAWVLAGQCAHNATYWAHPACLDAALQSGAAGIAVQPERHSTPASPPQLRIPAAIEAYTTCTRLVGTRAHSSTLLMPATSAQDTSACSSHALGLPSASPLASCPAAHLHHLLTKPVSSARGRSSAAASPNGCIRIHEVDENTHTHGWLMLAMKIWLAQEIYLAVVLLLASASRGSP